MLGPVMGRRLTGTRLAERGAHLRRAAAAVGLSLAVMVCAGCATMGLRSAVDMTVKAGPDTPPSALVYVDGQYIGSLAAVVARGVRIPEGEHRISVEKTGYFPYDTIVVSNIEPIHLEVELLQLPE